ncbi:glycoside hydrolase family 15 protein [Belnapia moabensis]|uniref:glycoside hydrolase family 15 protein n=1 Tax=Belnapia moabensis TaxID=365533 RepID=UPI0005BBDE02|nr:glycoside hydrolase family 15 protein [Belnapia moabensis]
MTAPGAPGIRPSWTSSAKDIVGTAIGASRLWFTLGYGIVNEVYHPRVDLPQIRDLGFIVADDKGFWTEVKRNADYSLATAGPGIPAVQVVHRHPRFELTLRIAPESDRDVLLIEAVLTGDADLRLYVLLAPHCGGTGEGNSAALHRDRERLLLCAEQGSHALALAAAEPATQREGWSRASAGFVGTSDGWQDFATNGAMRWEYEEAGPGNVALLGELRGPSAVLALGFASERESAATLALSALLQPFDAVWRRHVEAWEAWQAANVNPGACDDEFREAAHVSAMVLRVHQDKTFLGAMVASLSIPWGSSTDDAGGYHLVWPRDLVESAGALLALGGWEEARNILRYLIATQLGDGRWAQNQWLGGKAHWTGIQLDEAAFPVLLASALAEADALGGIQAGDMVAKALRFILLHGPATDQDRWEETPGINTFTLAAAIAALVCGAELLGSGERRDLLLLADDWNSRIEDWCLGADPALVAAHGIPAYYVRAASPAVFADREGIRDRVPVRNHDGECLVPADTLISTDPLQLVRFGLRRADDPAILGTIRLIDALLRVETPSGPSWYRYNGDGYGEHEDGRPFNGTGRGRPWPLLTGERGQYELAAGREAEARDLLRAMTRMGSRLGLLPEQVWEAAAIPEHFLFPGRPSGSAMPLVWAHAEFMKLVASLRLGRPIDRPEPVWLRYGGERPRAKRAHWTRRMPVGWIRAGQGLRLLLEEPAVIRWQGGEARTTPGALGLHHADLPTETLAPGERFTFAIGDEAACGIRIGEGEG